LGIERPPRVFAVDNRDASAFDLPELSRLVLAHRSAEVVARSRELASLRQRQTLTSWLASAGIDRRLASAERMRAEVQRACADRLVEPIVDQLSQRLKTDPAVRSRVIEPVVRRRLSYWPIVNVLDATLGPVVSLVRSGGSDAQAVTNVLGGRDLSGLVRGTFADLVQREPQLLDVYAHRKLWELDSASLAAGALQRRVDDALRGHQETLASALSKPSMLARVLAPIATIGAAIWFPIVQPVLEVGLQPDAIAFGTESLRKLVSVLSASYLIESVGFLAIYFVALWMWLRWLAYRRVDRALGHAADADHPAGVVLAWNDQLLQPIDRHVSTLRDLQSRIERAAKPTQKAA
jgi:hypothetical protein